MKRWPIFTTLALSLAILAGCATLDEKQRTWIFQPSDSSWGGTGEMARNMQDVWIDFDSRASGKPARLHGLWLPATPGGANWTEGPTAVNNAAPGKGVNSGAGKPPVLLYLHGARWNVAGSAPRIRRMQELGFSVLAIDYRGFGKSTPGLPSEEMAYEDARAAWDWLAKKYPDQARYIFGHSLGGAIAIDLASKVKDESGTIVEGTFTSILDVFGTMQWGWLPISPLLTQHFESIRKVAQVGSPLLVVHGTNDSMIVPALGRKLFEAAQEPKAFVLVEGGSHHNTNDLGQAQYREALDELFGHGKVVKATATASAAALQAQNGSNAVVKR